MSGPRVTSGKDSVQEVRTPPEFLAAVSARFGRIGFDLSADSTNHVTDEWFGPGSMLANDSLTADWTQVDGLLWLNPPFAKMMKWVAKCAAHRDTNRIALLAPAAVGSNWFRNYVDGLALVLFTSPRLKFVGHRHPFPKDLMLAIYGEKPGYECWRWDTKETT